MTTALDFPVPYGVTVEGDGVNRIAQVIVGNRHVAQNSFVRLPDGPCRVAASWDGPQSVRLVHAGHGYPVIIPSGGGYRSGMATIGATAGEALYLENTTNAPLGKRGRGTIEVYPIPT